MINNIRFQVFLIVAQIFTLTALPVQADALIGANLQDWVNSAITWKR